jgi:hypothetical protein
MSNGDGMASSTQGTHCQVRLGACSRVLSCQALNANASWGPASSGAYPIPKAPEHGYRETGTSGAE